MTESGKQQPTTIHLQRCMDPPPTQGSFPCRLFGKCSDSGTWVW